MMGPRPGPPETPGIKTRAAGFGGSPFWASRWSQVSLRLLIVYLIHIISIIITIISRMCIKQNIHIMGPRPGPPETPGIFSRVAGSGGPHSGLRDAVKFRHAYL